MSGFYYERNQVLDDTGWDFQPAGFSRRWLMGLGILLILVAVAYPYLQSGRETEHLKAASVYVRSDFGIGSGFFINAKGEVLTNHHVVVDKAGTKSSSVKVILYSGTEERKEFSAKIISLGRVDPKAEEKGNLQGDWALLQVQSPPVGLSYLTLPEEGKVVTEADEVRALGFPKGEEYTTGEYGPKVSVKTGTVTRADTQGNRLVRLTHNTALDEGMSGGPLVLKGTTSVIGINTMVTIASRAPEDYALPISSLPADILKRFGE